MAACAWCLMSTTAECTLTCGRAGERADPDTAGEWLGRAWATSYRSQVPDSMLLGFKDVATFLFDQASGAGAAQADRTIAAWGIPPAWTQATGCVLPARLPLADRARGAASG